MEKQVKSGFKKALTAGLLLSLLLLFSEGSFSRLDAQAEPFSFGYIGLRPDGNRYIPGKGTFPHVRALDIELSAKPVWVAAVRTRNGSVWAVSLQDGRTQLFSIEAGGVSRLEGPVRKVPYGAPPVLTMDKGGADILPVQLYRGNYLTYPVVLPGSGKTVSINDQGDIVITTGDGKRNYDINALPDTRILFDERERLLLLTHPTDSYEHGILGDALEATAVTIIETEPVFRVVRRIPVERGRVIEGLSPIWTDIAKDGKREIILTVSDVSVGARIAVYSEEGELLGSGAEIGRGYRWMHQLAVAPFDEDGKVELAVVRTPHIGGVVEFYGFSGTDLTISARLSGFSTHRIGSRNLDTAVACDFDGDGKVELLLPNQRFDTLLLLSRTGERIEIESTYPVGGSAATNITAVCGPGETCIVGVGREDGVLRVWVPYLNL